MSGLNHLPGCICVECEPNRRTSWPLYPVPNGGVFVADSRTLTSGSRTFTPDDLAQVRASNDRMRAECRDRVQSVTDADRLRDALLWMCEHDMDLVNEALTEAGVAP